MMSKETEMEALNKIQEIVDILSTLHDLPDDVREGLRIIEELARHRDISNVNPKDIEWLNRMKRAVR